MNRIVPQALAVIFFVCGLAGCAGPTSTATVLGYQSRVVTRTEGGLNVSTSVLSPKESNALYGVPLADKQIQPVWIEVQNREDLCYFLLSPGLDPDFFPASEAAEAFAGNASPDQQAAIRHDGRWRLALIFEGFPNEGLRFPVAIRK
jgi:hypothetical protein